MMEALGFGVSQSWFPILILTVTSSMILRKFLNVPEPQGSFPAVTLVVVGDVCESGWWGPSGGFREKSAWQGAWSPVADMIPGA